MTLSTLHSLPCHVVEIPEGHISSYIYVNACQCFHFMSESAWHHVFKILQYIIGPEHATLPDNVIVEAGILNLLKKT